MIAPEQTSSDERSPQLVKDSLSMCRDSDWKITAEAGANSEPGLAGGSIRKRQMQRGAIPSKKK